MQHGQTNGDHETELATENDFAMEATTSEQPDSAGGDDTYWTTTTSTTGIIDDTLNNNVNDSFNGNDIGRNNHRTGFDYGPSPDYDFGTVK